MTGGNSMQHANFYTNTERFWLAALGVFGFIVEALVLVGVFAYLFKRWGVSRLGWGWFVFLSLLGSIAFAIPVVLLYRRQDERELPSA